MSETLNEFYCDVLAICEEYGHHADDRLDLINEAMAAINEYWEQRERKGGLGR